MKTCSKCSEEKDLSEFGPEARGRGGSRAYCHECRRAYYRAYRKKNRARLAAASRDRHLKTAYGLEPGAFEQMYADQNGCCASCGDSAPASGSVATAIHVDHCHETGRVRGLLCRFCNSALGQLQDDPRRVAALLTYALEEC